MTFSRRLACLAGHRSRSPGSPSATPRRWWPNPRSEHDREASSRPSRVHVCGRFGSDRPACAGYRLHPGGGGMWAQGEQQGEQRSEEHTSELQSQSNLVCRLLLEKKKKTKSDKLN